MNLRLLFLLILAFASSSAAIAQQNKNQALPDSLRTHTFFFRQTPYFRSDSLQPDTSFAAFKEYDELYGYPALIIGNSGHARYGVVYHRGFFDPSINKGFDSYFRKQDSIVYGQTERPYSSLTYTMASKRDQFFNILHTQNFGEHFNVKLDLTKRGSIGFYNNLKTNNTFFDFSTNYRSKNERYAFVASYYVNRINAQENGGFEDFELVNNPDLAGTSRLDDAINRVKDQRYATRHSFRFGKTTTFLGKDSIERKNFKPFVELAYDFQYGKTHKFYNDITPGQEFYPAIFLDSLTTNDSVLQKNYRNEFILSILNGKYAFVGLSAGHEFFHQTQSLLVDTSFNNYFAGGFFRALWSGVDWKTSGRYFLKGYNQGDILLQSILKSRTAGVDTIHRPRFSLDLRYRLKEPEYFLTRYESNHFIWSNRFAKTTTIDLAAGIDIFKFSLLAELATIRDLIFFDVDAQPFQFNRRIDIAAITLARNIRVGNFHLESRLTYQNNSEQRILPLPHWVIKETFYYQNTIFRDALLTRLGVNVFYYSEHNGYSYMPVLNQFYLSPQGNGKLGNYPYLSAFIDMKIKRMKLFFMFTHLNKGFSGDQFYRVPHYPMQPRAFQFGLNWKLLP